MFLSKKPEAGINNFKTKCFIIGLSFFNGRVLGYVAVKIKVIGIIFKINPEPWLMLRKLLEGKGRRRLVLTEKNVRIRLFYASGNL